MNYNDINYEELKEDLIDYFGTAGVTVSPVAFMNLSDVENASKEELINIALDNNFDLKNYVNNKKTKTLND